MDGRKRPAFDDVDDDGLADATDSVHIGLSRLIPTQLVHYFDDGWVGSIKCKCMVVFHFSRTIRSLSDVAGFDVESVCHLKAGWFII